MVPPTSHRPGQLAMGCLPSWASPPRGPTATRCNKARHPPGTILHDPPSRPRGFLARWTRASRARTERPLCASRATPGGAGCRTAYPRLRPARPAPSGSRTGAAAATAGHAAGFPASRSGLVGRFSRTRPAQERRRGCKQRFFEAPVRRPASTRPGSDPRKIRLPIRPRTPIVSGQPHDNPPDTSPFLDPRDQRNGRLRPACPAR